MSEVKDAAKRPMKRVPKKKVCVFCVEKTDEADYKDVAKLKRFITEKGKLMPKRMTGTCAKHQRVIAEAVKRARIMALLPFKGE
ncbi:MAG: 30S ribosomal protein S18 [Clostridiales bacterium]|jgi:small subunit ribosomal protein S18|nr:30S ribosomal protein S18 [Clostridiales bacterium]